MNHRGKSICECLKYLKYVSINRRNRNAKRLSLCGTALVPLVFAFCSLSLSLGWRWVVISMHLKLCILYMYTSNEWDRWRARAIYLQNVEINCDDYPWEYLQIIAMHFMHSLTHTHTQSCKNECGMKKSFAILSEANIAIEFQNENYFLLYSCASECVTLVRQMNGTRLKTWNKCESQDSFQCIAFN